MIYSNAKLNNTYCRYHKYGSDSIYRQRFTRQWIIPKRKLRRPISNSNLGMEHKLKSNCGMKDCNRTKQ